MVLLSCRSVYIVFKDLMEIPSLKKKNASQIWDSNSISQEIAVGDQTGTILFLEEVKRSESMSSTVDRKAKRQPMNLSLRVRLKRKT